MGPEGLLLCFINEPVVYRGLGFEALRLGVWGCYRDHVGISSPYQRASWVCVGTCIEFKVRVPLK